MVAEVGKSMKEPKIFGQPKYEVENMADSITRVKEAERSQSAIYKAAVKLLKRRQKALTSLLRSITNNRKEA